MKHRNKCQHCGNGFLAEPWSVHTYKKCCFRAGCEKKSSIYVKPSLKRQTLPNSN